MVRIRITVTDSRMYPQRGACTNHHLGALMQTIRDFIRTPVTDLESAQSYIRTLVENGCEYQLGDDPHEMQIFSKAEAAFVARRIRACYRQQWPEYYGCPIGYMIQATERWKLAKLTHAQKLELLDTIEWQAGDPHRRREVIAILEWNDSNGDFVECTDAELQEILADLQQE